MWGDVEWCAGDTCRICRVMWGDVWNNDDLCRVLWSGVWRQYMWKYVVMWGDVWGNDDLRGVMWCGMG